jgi:PEP-CTERM motif
MKNSVLIVLLVAILSVPALAQYDNGPINGTVDGWAINFGYAVSDTFTLNSTISINGMQFGAWLYPGDVLQSVEVSITSSEFGGTSYFDQVVNFTQSGCVANQYGFNVCTESAAFGGPMLNAGTYWLNLSNASVASGDPVYWDENSGPSSASESAVGTIPSESFTVGCCMPPPPTTPEPGSLLLLGSGVLAVLSGVRRVVR